MVFHGIFSDVDFGQLSLVLEKCRKFDHLINAINGIFPSFSSIQIDAYGGLRVIYVKLGKERQQQEVNLQFPLYPPLP